MQLSVLIITIFTIIIGLPFQGAQKLNEKLNKQFSDCDGTNMIFENSNPTINEKFLQDSKMTCLNLENRGIVFISSDAFNDIPNLEYLNLANNRLKKEQFLSLGRHKNLKMLVLDKSIRGGYQNQTGFKNYLKILQLKGYFPKLEKLYLRNNSIAIISIRGANSIFPNLTHLYLNNNEITNESPHYDRNFHWLPKSLKELHLENNDLDYFGLGNYPHLEFISIDNNRITDITLWEMGKLKYFTASKNEISWISDFSKSPLLMILNLSHNRIRSLNHIHKMPSLRELNLDNNLLHSIPKIEYIPNIKLLSLKCNEIRLLSKFDFQTMLTLEELNLDNNRIKFIGEDVFENLLNLKIINLEQNKLTHINFGWMMNLKIVELNLKGNFFANLKSMGLSDSRIELKLHLDGKFQERMINFREKLPVNMTIDVNGESVVKFCKKHVTKAIHPFDWSNSQKEW